uniref:Uncharacterized protein n=1 Tax=Setaria italica TaxID=4555 RepID=K3Z1N8_SETIT
MHKIVTRSTSICTMRSLTQPQFVLLLDYRRHKKGGKRSRTPTKSNCTFFFSWHSGLRPKLSGSVGPRY